MEPFAHQRLCVDEYGLAAAWGHFHEQGTGKSKTAIDTAAGLVVRGLIDGVFIVAPSGVHRNWIVEEMPKHWPSDIPETEFFCWYTDKAQAQFFQKKYANFKAYQGCKVLSISYDGMQTKQGKKVAWDFLRKRKRLYILDESARIKTPSAKRTRTAIASSVYAPYKRILTGTPIANSPFDVYTQIRFLDPKFWERELNIGSFSAFKNHYAQFETIKFNKKSFEKLVAYRNLDELHEILKKISDRVLKEDVLDLPPKLYSASNFELTNKQKEAYTSVKDEFMLFLESGELVTAALAIVRLLRLQQITSGFIRHEGNTVKIIPRKVNPRIHLLKEHLCDLPHQSIIWARFHFDVDSAAEASRLAGRTPVLYDGRTSEFERIAALNAMKNGTAHDFIANPAAAGEGLTITEAKSTFYYSNSFNLTHRLQSEDRNHRIGQDQSVTYTDLVANNTIDEYIRNSLISKHDVSQQILGDEVKEWLAKSL